MCDVHECIMHSSVSWLLERVRAVPFWVGAASLLGASLCSSCESGCAAGFSVLGEAVLSFGSAAGQVVL